MGLTKIPVTIAHPVDPEKSIELEFLVDSGALYSVVPRIVLHRLGIKPVDKRRFFLANGKSIWRQVGVAMFAYEGHKGGASVMFGEKNDSVLLGATTLEALGLTLNPFTREITRMSLNV